MPKYLIQAEEGTDSSSAEQSSSDSDLDSSSSHYVHLLLIPNIILLVVCLMTATEANQFFPHATSRSAWWPWSTCFEPVNPYETCSQFLLDEYSFTHFSHGFVLWFWLIAAPLRYLLTRPSIRPFCACAPGLSFDWLGFYVCAFVEILWEMFENTPSTIEAFRQSGPNSAEYAGDSGVNIIGDLIACQLGFAVMAMVWMRLKCKGAFAVTAAYAVIMTIVLYFWICDGLILIWINIARPGSITCVEAPPEHMLGNATAVNAMSAGA